MADVIVMDEGQSRGAVATDTTARGPGSSEAGGAAASSDNGDMLGFVELLFFGYRDFTAESDAVLAKLDLGRAHHRVLHFVHWMPGQRVIDLLDVLKITKQSLARVLKDLIDSGLVEQRAGASDRRERLLYSTATGQALAEDLARLQTQRIETALAAAGADGQDAVRRFLEALIIAPDRTRAMADARRSRHRPAEPNAR